MDRRPLKWNYNESLAMNLLEILFLCMFFVYFVFEGLWWKFFKVLEA